MACPRQEALLRFALGVSSADEQEEIEEHLCEPWCSKCFDFVCAHAQSDDVEANPDPTDGANVKLTSLQKVGFVVAVVVVVVSLVVFFSAWQMRQADKHDPITKLDDVRFHSVVYADQ